MNPPCPPKVSEVHRRSPTEAQVSDCSPQVSDRGAGWNDQTHHSSFTTIGGFK
jgi:hypothetical protein